MVAIRKGVINFISIIMNYKRPLLTQSPGCPKKHKNQNNMKEKVWGGIEASLFLKSKEGIEAWYV